jgi:hypothetical protein
VVLASVHNVQPPSEAKRCNLSCQPPRQEHSMQAGSTVPSKERSVAWNAQEDALLLDLTTRLGAKDWCLIASAMETRTARQCRERYKNHVKPTLRTGLCGARCPAPLVWRPGRCRVRARSATPARRTGDRAHWACAAEAGRLPFSAPDPGGAAEGLGGSALRPPLRTTRQ